MGVKETPSIAELECYFCNLSLDLQAKESSKGKNWSCSSVLLEEGRPSFGSYGYGEFASRRFHKDVSTFSKNQR